MHLRQSHEARDQAGAFCLHHLRKVSVEFSDDRHGGKVHQEKRGQEWHGLKWLTPAMKHCTPG